MSSHSEICHIWANLTREQIANGYGRNGSNMRVDGAFLFTWGTHLARHVENKRGERGVILNATRYSNSSSKHLHHARRAIGYGAGNVFEIGGLSRGGVLCNVTPEELHDYATGQAVECANAAMRARLYRDQHETRAREWICKANAVRAFFGMRRKELPETFDTCAELGAKIKRQTEAQARKQKRAEAEAAKREQERRAELVKDCREDLELWRSHQRERLSAHAHGVVGDVLGTTDDGFLPNAALRLSKDKTRVETSQGAQVFLRTVRFLWDFCAGARATNRPVPPETLERFPRLDHYTCDGIDAHGNLRVGCHRIAFAELASIALTLNLPPFNGEKLPLFPVVPSVETVNT